MGYTHYWYSATELDAKKWKQFARDCKKIFAASKTIGIDLANGSGDPGSLPEITPELISFNGSEKQQPGQWTTSEKISIPWPAEMAGITDHNPDPISDKTAGTWFAGDLLTQRTAPINNQTGHGSGSYETCCFKRTGELSKWAKEEGEAKCFNCCKTAYRPYDLTVTACLIAYKHHFGDLVKISTDGEEKDWVDGRILCQNVLGYGLTTELF